MAHSRVPSRICCYDNAYNFVATTAHAKWMSIAFIAHILEFSVPDAKDITLRFQDLCSKARATAGYYKRRSHARTELHDIQKASGARKLEVVQNVSTHCGSEFLMLSHLLELEAVTTVHLASTSVHDILTATEWQTACAYVPVLKTINKAAKLQ